MSNYVDKYGLFNVKPVDPETMEPTGNDGPIVTAYGRKIGVHSDFHTHLVYYGQLKKIPATHIPLERLPGKETPYPSRDSILGWYWLGMLSVAELKHNDWYFSPLPIPKFNLFQFIKEARLALKNDRNYFWKFRLTQIYRFAFRVPIQDRAYMLEESGLEVPLFYKIYSFFSDKVFKSKSDSSRLISWAKGKEELDVAVFERYFGPEHDFTKIVKGQAFIHNARNK